MEDAGSQDDAESFVSNIPLTALFGSHPKTVIVGVMLAEDDEPPTDFSVNEISRIGGLDAESVEEHVADLLELGVVVETDEIDDPTYRIDESLDVVERVRQLDDDLAELVFRTGE